MANDKKNIYDVELMNRVNEKESKRGKRKKVFIDKINMYDMLIANLIAGNSVIEPEKKIGNSNIQIGFSNISSDTQITKYYMIRKLPDYLQPRIIDYIRSRCVRPGIKINFYMYGNPYKINWNSAEMKNKMYIWKEYVNEHSNQIDTFDYRYQREGDIAKKRIINSTKYLNDAELNQKRSLIRVAFVIEISANRDNESIINMLNAISDLKSLCTLQDIKLTEIKANLLDWVNYLSIFSLMEIKELKGKMAFRVLTDDLLSNFNSYKQGRIGTCGVPLGMDVESGTPVIKEIGNPDEAENWLVSACTGGGKSYWVKVLLSYLLASNFVVTVMDYEGDEYDNLAYYVAEYKKSDVKIVSLGKGSDVYFDPCEIPELTGDDDIDNDLKDVAIKYIIAIFRIIVSDLNGQLTQWEERVISMAIDRTYASYGVTDDKATWHRSKGLRLKMVYECIKDIVECKELIDENVDNVGHKAAVKVMNAASIYFEDGQSKASTFKNPMPVESLYEAKLIIFSFGMNGASDSSTDPTILALKQLSVASVSIQISNYCKYVKHIYNVKVWEEFQRWGDAKGSSEIISNAITGGRKRGDINFILTNDLAGLIADENPISKRLRQNINNYAIGRINDNDIRLQFCKKFDLMDCKYALDKIAKESLADNSNGISSGNKYNKSFCVMLSNGKKAIVKAAVPPSLRDSNLFKTGVENVKQ